MGLGPSLRLRRGLVALVLGLSACSAPDEGAEEIEAVELGAASSNLRASKWVKLWSDLPPDRGGPAHFHACQGEPFKFTLSFRNMGSAIWRDVPGHGDEVGSDVFLETANGKKDGLTGKTRFSLRWNANDFVRGDRKAKECTTQRGCRRTRAVHDGIDAKAPTKPGLYRSRWRLRDYSQAWEKPQGFGPKVELRVRVGECPRPGECPCKVACSDGTNTVAWLADGSDYICEQQAQVYCLPYETVSHVFGPCPVGGAGGSGGSPGAVNADQPPDGPGFWITDAEDGVVGAGGSSGAGGSGGAGASSGAAGAGWWWGDGDDSGIGIDGVKDDPDYQPDGFDGVAEELESGVVPATDSGCALSRKRERSAPLALACAVAAGALLLRRLRSKSEL